jgi:predicted PurR-regulated permease PerM
MMLHNERLMRTLLILGILSALVFLGSFLWEIGRNLGDLLLLLAMAWFVAYVLTPIAEWLNRGPIPQFVIDFARQRRWTRLASGMDAFHIPYGLSAVMLYTVVLLTLVLAMILLVPGIIKQLGQLANQIPKVVQNIPEEWQGIQDALVRQCHPFRPARRQRCCQHPARAHPQPLHHARPQTFV